MKYEGIGNKKTILRNQYSKEDCIKIKKKQARGRRKSVNLQLAVYMCLESAIIYISTSCYLLPINLDNYISIKLNN